MSAALQRDGFELSEQTICSLYERAQFYADEGHFDRAELLALALERMTTDPAVRLFRGELLIEQGRTYEAMQLIDDVLAADARNLDARVSRAHLLLRSGEITAAVEELARVHAEASPDDPAVERAKQLVGWALGEHG